MSIAHAILGVLADHERHGYELARELAGRVGGETYNTGQIHQALEALEKEGLAVSRTAVESSRTRRSFRITPAGRTKFMAWLETPAVPNRPVRDDMLLKLVFLAERDKSGALRLLESRRRSVLAQLAEQPVDEVPPLARLTLDAIRFRLEAELRWVDHCVASLRPTVAAPGAEQAEEPPPPLQALPEKAPSSRQYWSGRRSASEPPSTNSTQPQQKVLSGPSRKATAPATCSGRPSPSGMGKARIAGP